MSALCLPMPRWFTSDRATGRCDAATGICDAHAVDASGRRVTLAPGGTALGIAVARHVRAGRLSDVVRAYADGILVGVAPTDTVGAAQAILEAVAREVRYTPDPHRAEVAQHPDRLLVTRAGDCDDMAALVGALAESVGIPARIVLVRYAPGGPDVWDHVYAELDVAPPGQTDWRAADATLPAVLGRPATLGDAPVTPGGVTGTDAVLILDPYRADDGAPTTMRTLARPIGNPSLFGGGGLQFNPGGFGLDFGGGLNLGSGFDLGFGGVGGFGYDPTAAFGSGFALFNKQTPGYGTAQWVGAIVAILTAATPFILALFGRRRSDAQAGGAIFSPTSSQPPPGYRRIVNPNTGETVDVPESYLVSEAQAWGEYQERSGGLGFGTVLMVGAAAVGAYYLAKRK